MLNAKELPGVVISLIYIRSGGRKTDPEPMLCLSKFAGKEQYEEGINLENRAEFDAIVNLLNDDRNEHDMVPQIGGGKRKRRAALESTDDESEDESDESSSSDESPPPPKKNKGDRLQKASKN